MKRIKIDHSKCTGCRHCEAACSLHHYENEVNPKKSRIRIFEEGKILLPGDSRSFYRSRVHGKESCHH